MQQHQISSIGAHGCHANRFYGATCNCGGGLMSDTVPEDDRIWQQPGETLLSFTTEIEELKSTFHTMISTM